MKRFLIKHGTECKCGHSAGEHAASEGPCEAPDTRPLFESVEKGAACPCPRYRPSLLAFALEFL